MRQRFVQRVDAGLRRKLTKRVQGGELFLEPAFARHMGECNPECAGRSHELGVPHWQKAFEHKGHQSSPRLIFGGRMMRGILSVCSCKVVGREIYESNWRRHLETG